MTKPLLFFLGTAEFGRHCLQALIDDGYKVVVITKPDAPAGRGHKLKSSPIKQLAQNLNLTVFEPATQNDLIKLIENYQPQVGIVVAYGKILKNKVISLFKLGLYNLHPSLLPKYRGPAPIQTSLLNGDQITGTSLIQIDEEIDHGPILAQVPYKITNTETAGSLHDNLANLSADLLIANLPLIIEQKISGQVQDHSLATFTQKINKDQTEISLEQTAEQVLNQIKALSPWPGAWVNLNNKRIKILQASLTPTPKALTLSTKNGTVYCQLIQPENSRIMTSQDYLNGLN